MKALFRKPILWASVVGVVLGAGCAKKKAVVELERGKFTIQLLEKDAPKTVHNFRKLIKADFYDGLAFHRVEPGFVVQGGDPKGDGTGGPGLDLGKKLGVEMAPPPTEGGSPPDYYMIPAEINSQKHEAGTLGMARQPDMMNPKKNSNGSQFYICLNAQPHLDGQYTVFGQVVEGMDVVKAIQRGDKIKNIKLK